MMTKRIYLIGFMGVGKSSTAAKLSKNIGYELIDTDKLIEERQGRKISEIFATDGEDYFRKLEQEAIRSTFKLENIIVSTGGGLACFFDNLKEMKEHGVVISLNASAETILKRTAKDTARPLLQAEENEKLLKIKTLLQKRAYYYMNADFMLDVNKLSVSQVEKEIRELINR